MVVVTKTLCAHPAYQPKVESKKNVECYALDNSPIKPLEQLSNENEYDELTSDLNTAKVRLEIQNE